MKNKYICLIILFLIIVSCIAFGRIADNAFISFDDGRYIVGNKHVQSGINPENIQWAFTAVVSGNWHPLTMISHTLDWSMFGVNPAGHHLVNMFLHIGAVIFLFLFLNRTTHHVWPAAFAAAFFTLHPLRVESVAWAAERKDVLSMFFGMACLYAYAFYAENSKFSRYLVCLTLFALSLMSKPMLVTLPFVLLLLDYWPLGRWQKIAADEEDPLVSAANTENIKPESVKKNIVEGKNKFKPRRRLHLLWEKTPFLILTFMSCVLTLWAQNKGGLVISFENIPLPARALNAVIAYVAYLEKILWPTDFAIHYPYEFPFPAWKLIFSIVILIGMSIFVFYKIKKMPFLFVGWFWYLGTLVPVIGLIQVASQAMADRYTYMTSIGITLMLVWGVNFIFTQNGIRQKVIFPVAIAIILVLAVLTWKQCGYWKNSITLFSHALQVTENNDMAHGGLAIALLNEGKTEEAIDQFSQALRIKQLYQFYRLRGIAYEKLGKHQQAVEDYSAAINLKPDIAEDYYNRGVACLHLAQYQRAVEDFNQAIQLKQDYADAYNNRGYLFLVQEQNQPGCADAQKACALGNCKTLDWARGKGYCR